MLGPFERHLALRYLRGAESTSGKGRGFLRFVTFVAIGGVAVGTAALLLAMMISRGFTREIETKIVGFGQHVHVENFTGEPLVASDSLVEALSSLEHVRRVSPAVIDFGLLRSRSRTGVPIVEGLLLWGTTPAAQPFIADRLVSGHLRFTPNADGHPGIVIGRRLAERRDLQVGDRVTAFAVRGLNRGALGGRPKVRQFHVAGIFETGLADFDEQFAYASIDDMRALFDYADNKVTRFDLTLDALENSRPVAEQATRAAGPAALARSVYDVYHGLFAWVDLQQSIIPLVISILVIVAAFNIIGALLMVVLEKMGDIGTVLSMGASRATVRRLFLLLGILIGTIGATVGTTLALTFGIAQQRWGFIPIPTEAYYLDTAPIEIQALDVAWIFVVAIVLCTLASYIPARVASRVDPIRILRLGG